MIILFPSMYNDSTKVDDDYALEKQVAEELGYKTILFNYDSFIFGKKPFRLKIDDIELTDEDRQSAVIYRGWMMSTQMYGKMCSALSKIGLRLINAKDNYKFTHEFPYSYKYLKKYTPEIEIYDKDEEIDWKDVKSKFDRFIFKDYVKSVKGFGFPEYFDSTFSSVELDDYYKRFKEIRDESFTGGLVIKDYLNLKKDTEGNTNEYRCWFYNGKLIYYYRDTSNQLGKCVSDLNVSWVLKLPKLKSKFYTIDVAELKTGEWIVLETGDGQVSGLRDSDKEEFRGRVVEFYSKLAGDKKWEKKDTIKGRAKTDNKKKGESKNS